MIYGIRHHGPGSARSLLAALDARPPDVILLELPVEAEPVLMHAAHEAMTPPVAILFHRVDAPRQASYYPFAEFSPEWQAIRWALARGVPVRCFDLPAAHTFALRGSDEVVPSSQTEQKPVAPSEAGPPAAETAVGEETPPEPEAFFRPDPFEWLAKADGFSDGERWWNDRVEERRDHLGLFEAILEAVTALRTELALPESRETLLREAWMRQCLRAAEKENHGEIAVICGAWHAPVLGAGSKASDDRALLKNLPKHKIAATWIPWTDERLTMASGYGAGIRSPGWYGHLWRHPEDPIPRWITKGARILRKQGQEASSASVIEALRLANSLAGLRGRPLPGLDETLEAMKSVFCQGDALPLDFLRADLLVGTRLGKLPEGLPLLPLQQDIEATQKRLRLKPAASATALELDLREEGGRARSIFLHRLLALDIPWGRKTQSRSRGTFKEAWNLAWKPEFAVAIIDAAIFGTTVEMAATRRLSDLVPEHANLAIITEKLDLALQGALPGAVEILLRRLDAAAAGTNDLADLLEAIPPLARIARYGDVRATDASAVKHLLAGLTARIHAGLPTASSGIDEAAADRLSIATREHASALAMLEDTELTSEFHQVLGKMITMETIHPKVRGHAVRLLRDAAHLDDTEAARHLGFALSPGMPALASAAWMEGFLQGGGSMLVHDRGLLGLVDAWLAGLHPEAFQSTLPLLRRTFGTFAPPERARIAAGVASGNRGPSPAAAPIDLDVARAQPAVAAVAKLFRLTF